MRNKLVLPDEKLFENIDVFEMIHMFLLFWYGIWWYQPEDMGYSAGFFLKQMFGYVLEDFSESEADWICPTPNYFDSRETYSGWVIGKW